MKRRIIAGGICLVSSLVFQLSAQAQAQEKDVNLAADVVSSTCFFVTVKYKINSAGIGQTPVYLTEDLILAEQFNTRAAAVIRVLQIRHDGTDVPNADGVTVNVMPEEIRIIESDCNPVVPK